VKVVLATQNQNKMLEITSMFKDMPIQLVMLGEFCQDDVEETGLSFVENAIIKARFAAKQSRLPAISDDSGLVVPALNGEPGIYSARYSGLGKSNQEHLTKLLNEIKGIPQNQRQAYMHCTMVFMRSDHDPSPLIAEADWMGSIIETPRGTNGFGYDPVFWLPHEHKTAAELSLEEKNTQSHRFQALTTLKRIMAEKLCMLSQFVN